MTALNHISITDQVAALPQRPGVYQFFDANDKLLYIGKATQLRSRVQSYFRESTDLSAAKQIMVRQIVRLAHTVVDTEPEALLLETTLIKREQPPYNVLMKDDKNFQYIHITSDAYPRLTTVRNLPDKGRSGQYFGPYTSGRAVRRTMQLLKRIFRYCDNSPVEKRGVLVYPERHCLEYQMQRCVGPCAQAISPEQYQQIFTQITQFLRGDYQAIREYVESAMQEAAGDEAFEQAAQLRDQLQAIDQLMVRQKVVSTEQENADYLSLARVGRSAAVNVFTVRKGKLIRQQVFPLRNAVDQADSDVLADFRDQYYAHTVDVPRTVYLSTETRRGRRREMLALGIENAQVYLEQKKASFEKERDVAQAGLQALADALGLAPTDLHRIEVYDISNFQGKHSVGSMIVFTDGQPDNAQYRKFKIKTVQGPNDFASMKEVLNRRLRHLPGRAERVNKNAAGAGADKKQTIDPWPRPDLIIVDGGKGQLSAAKAIVHIVAPDMRLASLAKREEELFVVGRAEPIRLPADSPGYYLLQRMRDEAHRFAIGFYRKRHLKNLV